MTKCAIAPAMTRPKWKLTGNNSGGKGRVPHNLYLSVVWLVDLGLVACLVGGRSADSHDLLFCHRAGTLARPGSNGVTAAARGNSIHVKSST